MESEDDILIRFLRNLSNTQGPQNSSAQVPETSLSYCSYSLGYVEQNIYNCKTCGVLSGICLSCCCSCHKGHEIIDIGPKRNFRCDCGASKQPCQLFPYKTPNSNNYCHNFLGKFCVCDSPDSDFTRNSDMHLCVVCYDWFHSDCIRVYNDCHNFAPRKYHQKNFPVIPSDSENFFLVCEKCLNQNIFLVNKFRKFLALEERVEQWDFTEKYPYFSFFSKEWFDQRCECLECCKIELPGVEFFSFRNVARDDKEERFESLSHEDQVYIAHGISVLRQMLQESLRVSFRLNFRTEIEELRKRMMENRRSLNER